MCVIRKNQPKAFPLLFFVQTWECFSYYGLRTLLVLYLTQVLDFTQSKAFGVFAVYCALVEFGGIFGGRLADRVLGQRAAIVFGGWLMAVGHIILSLGEGETILYTSLGFIASGTGLFSSNVYSLLGMYYEKDDPRREQVYTLCYIGINLGAVLATFICGITATVIGWKAGFGVAAVGIILVNLSLFFFGHHLGGEGEAPQGVNIQTKLVSLLGVLLSVWVCKQAIQYQSHMMGLIPLICLGGVLYAAIVMMRHGSVSVKTVLSLGAYLLILTVFFSADEQIGSSLLVYYESFAKGSIWGYSIPASFIVGINPVTIICFGMLVSSVATRLNMGGSLRLLAGCLLGGAAFGLLSLSSLSQEVSVLYIVTAVAILTIGELLIAPTVYAFFSEAAPKGLQGLTMGLIPIGYSLASILSGRLNQSMAQEISEAGVGLYTIGYARIATLLLVTAVGIVIIKIKKEAIYGCCRIS